MKRIIIILISVFSFTCIKAQTDTASFRKDFLALLQDAQNEFAINQGVLEYKDTVKHRQYYTPKITLGSTEHVIQEKTDELGTCKAYLCSYDFTDTPSLITAMNYLPIVLDELNKMHSSGNYRGRDYKDDGGSNITELVDTKGNYIMEVVSNEKALVLRLYAKSWGTR
jgi:hypothetical protein